MGSVMDGMEPTGHKVCMNVRCGATSSRGWKQGWRLRSGERADLCADCGLAFELSRFCESFHADDAGWRTCNSCRKRVHCGCVASIHAFVLLDTGGITCQACVEQEEPQNAQTIYDDFNLDQGAGLGPTIGKETSGQDFSSRLRTRTDALNMNSSSEEELKVVKAVDEGLSGFMNIKQEPTTPGSSLHYLAEMARIAGSEDATGLRNGSGLTPHSEGSLVNTCLNMSLGLIPKKDDAGGPLPPAASGGDIKENVPKYSPGPYRPRHRQILPRPPPASRADTSARTETGGDSQPQRIPRPPGEGRGRNQLLPRYWPRITDQEIQQITSGDSNSIITPLFEKILSASDAGRIGRLVLPKACAEAYFPTISQPEGLPLKINDITGREWQFQFRFWPNNNSRMYVLEGVTPCIQAMRLQAGDTVTFSRLEPEGKLIMGYRRASSSAVQDSSTVSSGGGDGSRAELAGTSLHTGKETKFISAPDYKGAAKSKEVQSLLLADKKRGRPLGSKSKRLRLDSEDSLEIKTSWEEAQELLRPPPGITPSYVTIDGHQFEEYEEPPVLAKKTITRTRPSGEQERWVQCDDCSQFRRVPLDVFLHTRWTCADNVWDPKRAHCSAPKELSNEDIDQLVGNTTASGKQDAAEGKQSIDNPSGLDALATAAAIGDEKAASPPPPAPTTKHPRHRPGCTCIVCIQPPSGKGPKHKPNCVCNVCLTVKRRFKTLMMRRKKRQSEREAETARKKKAWEKDEAEVNSVSKWVPYQSTVSENGKASRLVYNREPLSKGNPFITERGKTFPFTGLLPPYPLSEENLMSKGQIDLNSQPEREEGQVRMSMMRLLQDASLPLDMYLKQQGMSSLVQNASPTLNAGAATDQRSDQQQVNGQAGAPSGAHSPDAGLTMHDRMQQGP